MNKHLFICCLILSSICSSISADHLKNQLRKLCFKSSQDAIEDSDIKFKKRLAKESDKRTFIIIEFIDVIEIVHAKKKNRKSLWDYQRIQNLDYQKIQVLLANTTKEKRNRSAESASA